MARKGNEMTEENARMRYALKNAENAITAILASQPEDDDKCHEHLRRGIREVRAMLTEEVVE